MGIFIHGGHIHFPSGTAESIFFSLYRSSAGSSFEHFCSKKNNQHQFSYNFLLAACSASIILADPAAIFKPWQRLVYFILLLLTASPLVSSKQLDIFRIQAFEWCMNLCVFVGVASFFCYFLGINYMRTIINVNDSFSGSFGGITPQSMLLGPVAGIAANWLLYKILKRYFSQTTFSPLILLMLGTCLCSMLLSSSRGAFLATVMTALYVLFMFTKDHIRKAPKIIFVLLLCFTAASPLIGNFADGLQNKQQANMEKAELYPHDKVYGTNELRNSSLLPYTELASLPKKKYELIYGL